MSVCRLSVTTLAEFACREGDLQRRTMAGPTALQGQRMHRKLQAQRGAHLNAEFKVERQFELGKHTIVLGGRIDLVDLENGVVQEIKTVHVDPQRLDTATRSLHRGQAVLYGACLLAHLPSPPQRLDIRLLYAHALENRVHEVHEQFTSSELERLAYLYLQRWLDWQCCLQEHRAKLQDTAHALGFPHDHWRPGQRELATATWRALRDGTSLLAVAPTGIGKTISTLFPAVKSLGAGHCAQVLYLTAKASGVSAATDALEQLGQEGLRVFAVSMRARSRSCFCERGFCERDDADTCPYTLSFHDRLPAAREAALKVGLLNAETIDALAEEHEVCPFQLAHHLLPWSDIAIADYNYAFDPLVGLAEFELPGPNLAVLVDEAHNLPDRARAMYSASLRRSDFRKLEKALGDADPTLRRALRSVSRQMRGLSPEADSRSPRVLLDIEELGALNRSVSALLLALLDSDAVSLEGDWGELYRQLCRHTVIAECFGDAHRLILSGERDGAFVEVTVELMCVDAERVLALKQARFESVVCFSATLYPPTLQRRALGLPENSAVLELPSPFDPERAPVFLVSQVSTRFRDRDRSLPVLIDTIEAVLKAHPGRYVCFLPSWRYLEDLTAAFAEHCPVYRYWSQSRSQDIAARGDFFTALSDEQPGVGFAVSGGSFGEGVDFSAHGLALDGVIVVGTALPPPSTEREQITAWHRQQGRDGDAEAYLYPGLRRVLQAAGRLIRRDCDRGVIVLIDDRFASARYRTLYPSHWLTQIVYSTEQLSAQLHAFWQRFPSAADEIRTGHVMGKKKPRSHDASEA